MSVVAPARLPGRLGSEVGSFLCVGGAGYVVDVVAFDLLRLHSPLGSVDPAYARVLAVAVAMVVTYAGTRLLTWRGAVGADRRREVGLFVLFNLVGTGFSVVALLVSHDLLGLVSPLDDNVSANGVGLLLGTAFRFWAYRTLVFSPATEERPRAHVW